MRNWWVGRFIWVLQLHNLWFFLINFYWSIDFTVLLVSTMYRKVNQLCLFFGFPSHLGHHRALSGEGNGIPLQYSCLENPMDGGAWWAVVHGVAKSRTWLSDFTFTFHFPALEKEMATHSSVLAWRIPGTGEPGGLPSMGSHRVGHDWSDLAAAAGELSSHMLQSN